MNTPENKQTHTPTSAPTGQDAQGTPTPRTDAESARLFGGKFNMGEICELMEAFARTLERELAQLERWKAEQMAVESAWDCQAVGKLLDLPLGTDIRRNIQPEIERLRARASLASDLAALVEKANKEPNEDGFWETFDELKNAAARYREAEAGEERKPNADGPAPYAPRQIATDFLNLPLHLKIKVAKSVGVLEAGDTSLKDSEMFQAFFRRANSQNKVTQLAEAIKAERAPRAERTE